VVLRKYGTETASGVWVDTDIWVDIDPETLAALGVQEPEEEPVDVPEESDEEPDDR
jgi:hypothetical protein